MTVIGISQQRKHWAVIVVRLGLARGVNKSGHSVRKISATRAANGGATVARLKALFDWIDYIMPSLYTRSADRVRLAKEAISKLEK